MTSTRSGGATAAQPRADINAGRTGAGAPIPARTVEQVRAAERAAELEPLSGPKESIAPDAALAKTIPAAGTWLGLGAAIGVVLVSLAWTMWR